MPRRTIFVSAKCSDMCSVVLKHDGVNQGFYDGYSPKFLNTDGDGDYVSMEIDIDTGQIVGWKKPTKKDLTIFKKSG